MPALLSSLIDVPRDDLSAALSGGASRLCLREWLLLVPDPRKRAGRWHPLEFVLVLAVCAFTAAGHDSPTAIAEWAAGCSRESLLLLGGRPDRLTGRVRPPSTRTFRRVFARIDADALNQVLLRLPGARVPQMTLTSGARKPGLSWEDRNTHGEAACI